MKYSIYIVVLLTLLLEAKSFTKVEFTGDTDTLTNTLTGEFDTDTLTDTLTGEFDRATLLKICHIEYPAIYKIWKPNPTFETKQIEGFVENLVNYSKSMGYYRAEVKSSVDENTIYLNITKNKPIKIKSVNISEEFERFTLFEEGKRFRTTDFTATKSKIVRHLEETGYPTYKMKAKAFVDLDLYKVDINMSIDKGIKRFFSKTDVNNTTTVDSKLIFEEIFYEEDELYNVFKLEESYDNIYRLGAFEQIKMEADFNNTNGKTPIHITLKEGENKEFASNIGYDTEEGARGGLAYIDHNFFGNLREFKAGLKVSERGYNSYTDFYDPQIEVPILEKITFRNELSYGKWDYDAYVEKLLTERVTFGKSFGKAFRKSSIGVDHFAGFQLEYSEIESGVPTFLAGNYRVNSIFYRLVIDGRDSEMDAKNGYYSSVYVEKAMKQLGSEIDYLKMLAEVRYIKEFKPIVWAFKIKAGTLSQETPPFKHFYLGGAMSNRGYEYRDLGPHSSGYPIGGTSIIDTSLESRYYMSENFAVVGFFDASKLSLDINDFSGEWYKSYGLGLRYLSVIGPLRLDVGYPQEGGFALHLGIGQVF